MSRDPSERLNDYLKLISKRLSDDGFEIQPLTPIGPYCLSLLARRAAPWEIGNQSRWVFCMALDESDYGTITDFSARAGSYAAEHKPHHLLYDPGFVYSFNLVVSDHFRQELKELVVSTKPATQGSVLEATYEFPILVSLRERRLYCYTHSVLTSRGLGLLGMGKWASKMLSFE